MEFAGLAKGMLKYNQSGYSTSLIGNYSLQWIKKVASDKSGLPWMAYIGPKACHDPFQPAPWYKDTWEEGWPATAPRPPSWNVTQDALAEHHPTISCRAPFGEQTATCIDANFKDRWRTLLSVDDLIEATVKLVDDELGLADQTYYVYSSVRPPSSPISVHSQDALHAAYAAPSLLSSACMTSSCVQCHGFSNEDNEYTKT
jgi:hypothetical protein